MGLVCRTLDCGDDIVDVKRLGDVFEGAALK
jgi:hypothetical protein